MTWSGAERVASRLAQVLDAQHVFTFAADQQVVERAFPGKAVTVSRLGQTRVARRRWDLLLPFMARWWRSLDLSRFDVVVTCSHSTVDAIRVRRSGTHLSYCCTPMRYAWYWREELGRVPKSLRAVWPVVAAVLRWTDRRRSRNPDEYIAVSAHVQQRIAECYGRVSRVVYPPVDTRFFSPDAATRPGGFFLFAGRLVAYKGADIAIQAANECGLQLVVAGSGPELDNLRSLAGPTVRFVVRPSDTALRELYRQATALVFPGIEDFGIVMVEAQACGTPVIAYEQGGAREAVLDGVTGVLYGEKSVAGLAETLRTFDRSTFDVAAIRRHAESFAVERFDREIESLVATLVASI